MGVCLRVGLVHGILSRGGWFEDVRRSLHGNFECVPLPYWQFLPPFVVPLFLYPVAILAMVATGLIALAAVLIGSQHVEEVFFTASSLQGISLPGPFLPLIALALVASDETTAQDLVLVAALATTTMALLHLLRRSAMKRVRRQLGRLCGDPRRPHLIAHSMGSWLGVNALLNSDTLSVDRMILAGCVLPRHFGWQRLKGRIGAVRNEVGRLDVVSALAPFIPDLGRAGVDGFRGDRSEVHDVAIPLGECSLCAALDPGDRPLVHNVVLERYGHSDVFLEELHARDLWLPVLWGFPPDSYKEFGAACARLNQLSNDMNWLQAEQKCKELRDQTWPWTTGYSPGNTLGQFVEATIRSRYAKIGRSLPDTDDELADLVSWVIVIAGGHLAMATAQLEMPTYQRDVNLARRLFPQTAIGAAVEDTTV